MGRALVTTFLIVLAILPCAAWAVERTVRASIYESNVGVPLRDADSSMSSDVIAARVHLAVSFLRDQGITNQSGYTSVFVKEPNEDVGFWFGHLEQADAMLQALGPNSTETQKDAAMMTFYRAVTPQGNTHGVYVPDGISVYPHNQLYTEWFWGGLAWAVLLTILAIWNHNRPRPTQQGEYGRTIQG